MASLKNLVVGAILVLAPIWWIVKGSAIYLGRSGVQDLITILNGGIPLVLLLFGLLLLWIEIEDIKVEREFRKERKRKKKKKK